MPDADNKFVQATDSLIALYRIVERTTLDLPFVSFIPMLIFFWAFLKFYFFLVVSAVLIIPVNFIILIKSPEEDKEASELYEAEEVVGVVFPTDEDAALPLNPSKQALHEPTSHIAASRRRSCVGGLLLLLRCGAIISMPSLRNSSSSGSLS